MDKKVNLALLLIAILALAAYTYFDLSSKPEILLLATTTSTYDSGLLDDILPDFEQQYDVTVKVIFVGTGQAIENGRRGDVDIILVHAPAAELQFVEEGYGVDRKCVMYNDFLIVGPEDDPAEIKGMSINDAMTGIAETESFFVSRGDDSGTHKKEQALWTAAGISPSGDWYREAGAGMGDTLRITNDMEGYTLSDRATYIALRDRYNLGIIVEGDDILLNPYGVIAVNPEKNDVNYKLASDFIGWIMSDSTQEMIGNFKKDGEQLFVPLRGECLEV